MNNLLSTKRFKLINKLLVVGRRRDEILSWQGKCAILNKMVFTSFDLILI